MSMVDLYQQSPDVILSSNNCIPQSFPMLVTKTIPVRKSIPRAARGEHIGVATDSQPEKVMAGAFGKWDLSEGYQANCERVK